MQDAVTLTTKKKDPDSPEETQTKTLKNIQYEWGSLNVMDFVQKLAQEGITNAKVDHGPNVVIIHLVSFIKKIFINISNYIFFLSLMKTL